MPFHSIAKTKTKTRKEHIPRNDNIKKTRRNNLKICTNGGSKSIMQSTPCKNLFGFKKWTPIDTQNNTIDTQNKNLFNFSVTTSRYRRVLN